MLAAKRVFRCSSPLSFKRPEYTSCRKRKASSNRSSCLYVFARLVCVVRGGRAVGRAACDRVNAAGNSTAGWRVVVSSGSRHGAAVLRETNALDEVVRPFATSVEAAAAALVARVKRSN